MEGDSGSKAPVIFGVASSMMALAVTAVAVRFWARWRTKTYLWWDDWLTLATLVSPVLLEVNDKF